MPPASRERERRSSAGALAALAKRGDEQSRVQRAGRVDPTSGPRVMRRDEFVICDPSNVDATVKGAIR